MKSTNFYNFFVISICSTHHSDAINSIISFYFIILFLPKFSKQFGKSVFNTIKVTIRAISLYCPNDNKNPGRVKKNFSEQHGGIYNAKSSRSVSKNRVYANIPLARERRIRKR